MFCTEIYIYIYTCNHQLQLPMVSSTLLLAPSPTSLRGASRSKAAAKEKDAVEHHNDVEQQAGKVAMKGRPQPGQVSWGGGCGR